jgi:hypothetical protein
MFVGAIPLWLPRKFMVATGLLPNICNYVVDVKLIINPIIYGIFLGDRITSKSM